MSEGRSLDRAGSSKFSLDIPAAWFSLLQFSDNPPMHLEKLSRQPYISLFYRLLSLIAILSAVAPGILITTAARAQDVTQVDWTTPINISHSGAAKDPVFIQGSKTDYIIWKDAYAGYYFAVRNGSDWSSPAMISLDTGKSSPHFISGPDNLLYALWIDADGQLNFSSVTIDGMGQTNAWAAPDKLSSSVVDLAVAVDEKGGLHLAYISSQASGATPAGVYYRRSLDEGKNWTEPLSVYQSSYFRTLAISDSHIQLTTTNANNNTQVFIAWDNRPRKLIYLASSLNGGQTWNPAQEIDHPQADSGFASPYNIQIGAYGRQAILVWQIGNPGASCTQEYRLSNDSGKTWTATGQMLQDFSVCPQANRFLGQIGDYILLNTSSQDSQSLLVWDGSQWSLPQIDPGLSSFIDPETHNTVSFSCLNPILLSDQKQLVVVGCDKGPGGDIWLTSRDIGDASKWFPKPSPWSKTAVITRSAAPQSGLVAAGDVQGRVHVIWSQKSSLSSDMATTLYYSRWDSGTWSQPIVILPSETGSLDQPSLAIDPSGQLLLAWTNRLSGQIYFSSATAEGATNTSDWKKPVPLPAPLPSCTSPRLLLTPSGVLFVIYVIPLNEDRGVYVVRSLDKGASWSKPYLIFDAAGTKWDMVDEPRIAVSGDGSLSTLWQRYSLPGGPGSLGLYSSRSTDGGEKWSDAETVIDKPVTWAEIAGVGEKTVHRLWEVKDAQRKVMEHQFSTNGGTQWSDPIIIIASFGGSEDQLSFSIDPAGQPHLLFAASDTKNRITISHWTWQGDRWLGDDPQSLAENTDSPAQSTGSTVSPDGKLSILISASEPSQDGSSSKYGLFILQRTLSLPSKLVTPLYTPVPITALQPTSQPTTQPTSPSDANLAPVGNINPDVKFASTSNSYTGIYIGIALTVILVILVFGLRLRSIYSRKPDKARPQN